jgi:hypothetical protein
MMSEHAVIQTIRTRNAQLGEAERGVGRTRAELGVADGAGNDVSPKC